MSFSLYFLLVISPCSQLYSPSLRYIQAANPRGKVIELIRANAAEELKTTLDSLDAKTRDDNLRRADPDGKERERAY